MKNNYSSQLEFVEKSSQLSEDFAINYLFLFQLKEEQKINSYNSQKRLIRLWLNIFTNFSLMPLRLATILGCFMAFTGFIGVIIVLIESLINGIIVRGWLSIICTTLLFGGIQCFLIGISGEYLGRVLMIVGSKPQSNIRNIYKYSPKSSKQNK